MQAWAGRPLGGYGRTRGVGQRVNFILSSQGTATTAPSVFQLVLDSDEGIPIPAGKVMAGTVTVVGVASNNTTVADGSKMARFVRQFSIKNVGGTTSLVGSVITVGEDQKDNSAYNLSLTADNTNKKLQINLSTGGEFLRWVAHVEGVEVAYG